MNASLRLSFALAALTGCSIGTYEGVAYTAPYAWFPIDPNANPYTLVVSSDGGWCDYNSGASTSVNPNSITLTFVLPRRPTVPNQYFSVGKAPPSVDANSLFAASIAITNSDCSIFDGEPIAGAGMLSIDSVSTQDDDPTITDGINGQFAITVESGNALHGSFSASNCTISKPSGSATCQNGSSSSD